MIKSGPERFQKPEIRIIKEGDKEKKSLSFLSKKWLYETLKNGDEILKSWLLYSNSHSRLYCFCCKLFQSRNDNSPFVFKPFINKWNELAPRLQVYQTIDKEMQNLTNKEKNRWREILQSVVAGIKFLSKQNLPFHGHRKDSNSRNQENFLETLELLANFSTVIKEYIFGTQLSKKGMTTYLSPTIQNE